MSKRFLLSLAAIALAGEAFASGMPPQVTVTSSPTGTQINTLPSSNPAGTSDTVAFPFQGVTGGVPVAVQSGSVVTGQASLTVGSSTSSVALGSVGPVVQVYNPGSAVVYVKLGGSSITAATTDTPVAPGSYLILNTGGASTYIAAIAPTGTPTLTITTGTGTPLGWGGGSSGGGGGGTSSSFGAAFPATGTAIGVSSGGNMVALTLGQVAMASSVPVVIASNQSGLPILTWGGGTLGAMANYGTSPGAVLVPGVNSYITNSPTLGAGSAIIGKVGIDQTTPGVTNGTVAVLYQGGGGALSATNGIYANLLQGNAVLSASNPIFTTGSIAGAAVSATNGGYVNILQGNAVNASGNPIFVQSTAGSAIMGKVGIDQTTPGTTNAVQANAGTNLNTSALALETGGNLATLAGGVSASVYQENLKQVNGVTILANAGAVGTGSQRVAVGQDTTTIAGSAPGTAGSASANVVTVQGAAGMTAVTVTGSTGVGGFDADVPTQLTVQNAAYSAGNSLGGLQTISIFRTTLQPSGIINQVSLMSRGGSTVGMTVYAFDTNPTGTTCTDKSAFSLAAADLLKLVSGFPIVITPQTAQGITASVGYQPVVASVKNQDGSVTQNIYVCVIANGSVTPATTSDLSIKIGIAQD